MRKYTKRKRQKIERSDSRRSRSYHSRSFSSAYLRPRAVRRNLRPAPRGEEESEGTSSTLSSEFSSDRTATASLGRLITSISRKLASLLLRPLVRLAIFLPSARGSGERRASVEERRDENEPAAIPSGNGDLCFQRIPEERKETDALVNYPDTVRHSFARWRSSLRVKGITAQCFFHSSYAGNLSRRSNNEFSTVKVIKFERREIEVETLLRQFNSILKL